MREDLFQSCDKERYEHDLLQNISFDVNTYNMIQDLIAVIIFWKM